MLARSVAYLTLASARNCVRVGLRRARSPRTLIAIAAGAAYVWWFLFRPAQQGGAAAMLDPAWSPRLTALGLTLLAAKWWLTGADRRALAFSPAEVTLLFPAPVTRHGLVAYKLLRAQLAILTNTVVFTVLLRGEGTHLASWRRALAVWVLFSVLYLHRLGASLLTAAPPADARAAHGWRRGLRLALPAVALAAIGVGIVVPLLEQRAALAAAWDVGLASVLRQLALVLDGPPARLALAPARWLVAPTFALEAGQWARTLAPALALLAAHFVWVLRIDAAVHEAALEASERRGRRGDSAVPDDAAPTPARRWASRWAPPLAPVGRAGVAIVWKNAVAALRAGALLRVLALYAVLAGGLLVVSLRAPRLAEVAGIVAGVWSGMLLLAGPLWVRFDLRHDLPHLAVLRAWPLRGREIVRAEIAASTLALTVFQVAILVLLLVAAAGARDAFGLAADERTAGALALVLALPGFNAATLTVHNAAALLFPAWVRPSGAPRSVEAMGQGLLSTGFALLVAALLLALPGALAAGIAWSAWPALDVWALVPAGAALTVAALAELGPVHAWLGGIFERTDPSAIGTAG